MSLYKRWWLDSDDVWRARGEDDVDTKPQSTPVAQFTVVPAGLTVHVDGSTSVDVGSTLTSWTWDFGDGGIGAGDHTDHTYTSGGAKTIVLTVTDELGNSGSVSHAIDVSFLQAAFTATASGLTVQVDATASTDTGATITDYAWTFGDGSTGAGPSATHTYTVAGSYTIGLRVADSLENTAATSQVITVTIPPGHPTASFNTSASALTVSVDASASSDIGGTIQSYAWTWGDGTAGANKTASHLYTTGGTYTVGLTVTDNTGQSNSASHTVTVTAPVGNKAPTAAFTTAVSNLTLTVDGTSSTDPDGTVVAWAWTWGDGTPAGTGSKTSHTYAAAGTYTVTLKVTDNGGAPGTASTTVTATAVPPASGGVPQWDHIIIVIYENHSVSEIYGNASAPYMTSFAKNNLYFTQSYAITHNSQPNYFHLFAGSQYSCPSGSSSDNTIDLGSQPNQFAQFDAASPKVTHKGYVESGGARKHNPWESFSNSGMPGCETNFSNFPSTAAGWATLPKVSWVIPNLTNDMHDNGVSPGDTWTKAHFTQTFIDWCKANNGLLILTFDEDDFTTTNHIYTAMAGAHVPLASQYTTKIDHHDVLALIEDSVGVPRINAAVGKPKLTSPWTSGGGGSVTPTAAFTSTVSGLAVTVDGSTSTNAATYAWTFGDGGVTTGVKPSHTYAAAGTYTITLTVTSSTGTPASVSHTVTVAVTPPPTTGWTLDWTDDFTSLNTATWTVDNNTTYGSGNNELEVQLASAVTVANSQLTVTANKLSSPISGMNYSSGHLNSRGKKEFMIGPNNPIKVEVRAQLPDVTHLLPAPIWLRPVDPNGMGEVDPIEATGTSDTDNSGNTRLSQTVHTLTYSPDVFAAHVTNLTDTGGVTNWHTYGTEIYGDHVLFFVDGVQTARVDSTTAQNGSTTPLGSTFAQIFGVDSLWFFHITLGVGGNWPGTPTNATVFPAKMNIDYVKVWRQSSTPPPVTGTLYFNADFPNTGGSFATGGTGNYAEAINPQNITLLSDPAGSGKKVVRFVTHDSDNQVLYPRTQVATAKQFVAGEDFYVGLSFYLPSDFRSTADTPHWVMMNEVYGPPFGGSGPNRLQIVNEHWGFYDVTAQTTSTLWNRALVRGKWQAYVMRCFLSTDPTKGFTELWWNANDGKGMVQQTINGGTRYYHATLKAGVNDGAPGNYNSLKVAYGDTSPSGATIYYGWHKIGTTLSIVSPPALPY